MVTELLIMLIMLVVAFALVGISVVAKRFEMNDLVVTSTYAGAFCFLTVSLQGLALIIFLGDIYAGLREDEILRMIMAGEQYKFVHGKLSDFGYPRLWVIATFCVAGAGLIMWMLSCFVEPPVDGSWYLLWFLIPLAIGIILLIGFSVLLEWLALVLGIVATVIGILIGIKKLAAR